mgnify:CR=1 FL=1
MNIERRIRYFLKNYEYDEKGIIREISSQFNLTEAITLQKIRETREKYQYLKKARNILKKFDEELLALVNEPDRVVEVNRNGVISHWQAATILSQAVHHVIEHKCQAVTALEFRGFKAPDLNASDVWGYERSTK